MKAKRFRRLGWEIVKYGIPLGVIGLIAVKPWDNRLTVGYVNSTLTQEEDPNFTGLLAIDLDGLERVSFRGVREDAYGVLSSIVHMEIGRLGGCQAVGMHLKDFLPSKYWIDIQGEDKKGEKSIDRATFTITPEGRCDVKSRLRNLGDIAYSGQETYVNGRLLPRRSFVDMSTSIDSTDMIDLFFFPPGNEVFVYSQKESN